jgi:FkbM family methyltransferase
MCNMTFTSDACIEAMNATNDELVGLHLCSCLMGYKVGGSFQSLFSQALVYAGNPGAALGHKHPLPPIRLERAAGAAANNDRLRAVEDAVFRSGLDHASMRGLFGYLGHRQDQTILSILAARYRAPLSSARKYCIANDNSSEASKINWESGGFSSKVGFSMATAETFGRSASIHHRGTYMNLENLDFGVIVNGPAIVLGNGPSLRGFDFDRLKPFAVFGMNAAYRYWDEIGWYPRFYSCLDQVVGMSHAEHIARLVRNAPEYGIERFLLRRKLIDHIGRVENCDRIVDFDLLRSGTRQFSRLPLTTGSHTLIWAAALGFREIYILGVDCNYVEIIPGADRREGTMLEITSAGENPNYFFSGYQQVGDKYNIPNSTSPDLHIDSWRAAAMAIQEYGARVLNANLKSRVDAFDFCRLEDVESGGGIEVIPRSKVVGDGAFYVRSDVASVSFDRSDAAQINESNMVLNLLGKVASTGVMLDVGAHCGGSLAGFAKAGWTVYAFEPDPQNRAKLERTFGGKPNVVISDEAVSDKAAQDVPFFASRESTGISSLAAFRDSHREVAKVRTITLNEIVARHGLVKVDFLKIDVEGFEMAVLRGLDLDRLKPSVIVAEFEDRKTKGIGYASHDLARLLVDRGYRVYVSEWHPIERYGVKHSWRGIQKYPCDIPADSWGNLVAFLDDPPASDLIKAVRAAADRPVHFAGYADVTDTSAISAAGNSSKESPHPRLAAAEIGAGNGSRQAARSVVSGVVPAENPPNKSQQLLRPKSRRAWLPVLMGALVLIAALIAAAAATRALPESWLGDLESSVLFSVIAANLLFSAIASGAVYVYLRARSKWLRRSIHSRIDDLTEQLKRQAAQERMAQERMAKLISAIDRRVTAGSQAISALEGRVTRHSQAISAHEGAGTRHSLAFSRLNSANASGARVHARLLDEAARVRLRGHWAPLFGLQFRPTALSYLAHQLCLAEDRCEGRLATTIETAMLRQLALRSLPGPEVDLIEIGTLFGIGAGLLYRFRGDRITRLRLTLVDPVSGYYAAGELDPVTGVTVGVDTLKRNLRALDVPEEDVLLLQGLSADEDIVAAAKQRSYDFALIDGDHSGEGVRRDFEIYGPLIRPGGLVLFDDYDTTEWPEIKPAVDDLMASAEGWEWLGADWRTGIARRLPVGSR